MKSELTLHKVALWTTSDLAMLLRAQIGPLEMLPAFEPGIAANAIELLL